MTTDPRPSGQPPCSGPVSAALEADVRTWVRRHGIVVWLDAADQFSDFVDRLAAARAAGELSYDVKRFRGSYLETLLDLDGVAEGSEKTSLLLHLPGFTEQTVKQTPLLELYEAGVRYRKRLDTLVGEAAAGQVRPELIAEFVASPDLSLDTADEWLAGCLSGDGGGVAAELRARTATDIVDDLVVNGSLARRFDQTGVATAIWNRLAATLGLTDAWRQAAGDVATRPDLVAATAAGWAMAVEYARDLSRAPVSPLLAGVRTLPAGVVEACVALASHLRHRHPDFYRRAADDAVGLLPEESSAARAEDLGDVDTFRFEEENVFAAACAALEANRFGEAGRYADARLAATATSGFWARTIPGREAAWRLAGAAARLGLAIETAGPMLPVAAGFAGVAEAYVAKGAAVDRCHRLLEQTRATAMVAHAGEFERLRAGIEATRLAYRAWADAWAKQFSAFCKSHGFLPDPSLQQRTIFDDVVKPIAADDGPTAYFVIDALRYEMAEELHKAFEDAVGTLAKLSARFAELPTVTEVGMNVLAPVARGGRLAAGAATDGFSAGFATGEFRVTSPETRRRAMHDRVGGGTCPLLNLDEVVGRDPASLKRSIGRARLVVVHGREIDVAGEAGVSLDEFDKAVRKIKAAWQLLREAGVRRFVVTSDHGFLLPMGPLAVLQPHGRRTDPHSRYAFAPVAAETGGEVAVRLADLGYDGAEGCVVFPETTALFDTGGRPPIFVHGGNSLQERLVPVVMATHRSQVGLSTMQYGVRAEAKAGVAGMHCIEATVGIATQTAMEFSAVEAIELALRAAEDEAVRAEVCDVRGADWDGSVIKAAIGQKFEVFFRLMGPVDTRVLVEVHHPGVDARVTPGRPEARFAVTPISPVSPARQAGGRPGTATAGDAAWLNGIEDAGFRQVFAHIAAHGAVTEQEVTTLLGGARGVRRFAIQFDGLAERAPFRVRIDNVGGVKRYVREGGDR
jgi:hypothetical protein